MHNAHGFVVVLFILHVIRRRYTSIIYIWGTLIISIIVTLVGMISSSTHVVSVLLYLDLRPHMKWRQMVTVLAKINVLTESTNVVFVYRFLTLQMGRYVPWEGVSRSRGAARWGMFRATA